MGKGIIGKLKEYGIYHLLSDSNLEDIILYVSNSNESISIAIKQYVINKPVYLIADSDKGYLCRVKDHDNNNREYFSYIDTSDGILNFNSLPECSNEIEKYNRFTSSRLYPCKLGINSNNIITTHTIM